MKLVEQRLNNTNQGLAWSFHVSPDSCENPEYYSDYIQMFAVTDYLTGMGVTHLLVDTDANIMAGYITIRATSLVSSNDDGTQRNVCKTVCNFLSETYF